MHAPIPVIDIFAGPGGLGEGFASALGASARPFFRLALSIEKDPVAHETLTLRALQRLLGHKGKQALWKRLAAGCPVGEVMAGHPALFKAVRAEAWNLELGAKQSAKVRKRVRERLGTEERWVLIGGPPCQAYSLAGRSRNRGKTNYVPEDDHRQKLYVDYLQILADHSPAVFVMENVKGLLSATLDSIRLFERIRSDLSDPHKALKRERGRRRGGTPRYKIHSLVAPASLFQDDPADFLIRSELYGIPQARHRIVLLGVREDAPTSLNEPVMHTLPQQPTRTTAATIGNLQRLRSGLSKEADSFDGWVEALEQVPARPWFKQVSRGVQRNIVQAISSSREEPKGRGAEFLPAEEGGFVFNHASRSHIASDVERYLFAACFAEAEGYSPDLGLFPKGLRPDHKNVSKALEGGHFADRFRVQVADRPSTTITSHISKDGHYYIHYDPTQCRSLTVREAARLQTFPDDYFFCGPRTAQYHQVGNAVPPDLARQIAHVVAHALGESK